MREHFDLSGHLDGFAVYFEGQQILVTNTVTGAVRAINTAVEAAVQAVADLELLLASAPQARAA